MSFLPRAQLLTAPHHSKPTPLSWPSRSWAILNSSPPARRPTPRGCAVNPGPQPALVYPMAVPDVGWDLCQGLVMFSPAGAAPKWLPSGSGGGEQHVASWGRGSQGLLVNPLGQVPTRQAARLQQPGPDPRCAAVTKIKET